MKNRQQIPSQTALQAALKQIPSPTALQTKAVNKADMKARRDPRLTHRQDSKVKADSKADLTRRQDFKSRFQS